MILADILILQIRRLSVCQLYLHWNQHHLTALALLLKTTGWSTSYQNNCQRFGEFCHVQAITVFQARLSLTLSSRYGKLCGGKLHIICLSWAKKQIIEASSSAAQQRRPHGWRRGSCRVSLVLAPEILPVLLLCSFSTSLLQQHLCSGEEAGEQHGKWSKAAWASQEWRSPEWWTGSEEIAELWIQQFSSFTSGEEEGGKKLWFPIPHGGTGLELALLVMALWGLSCGAKADLILFPVPALSSCQDEYSVCSTAMYSTAWNTYSLLCFQGSPHT